MGPGNSITSTTAGKSYSVPKLAQDGSNWVTWKSQTLATLAVGQGIICHIEDTARQPPQIPNFPTNHSLTDDEEDHLERVEKCWDDYNQ